MTHISSVLDAVAPEPTRPFDASAFARHALLRRRRRFLRRLGAIVAAGLAVGVPTQLALSPAGRDGLDLDTVAPTTTTTAVPVSDDQATASGTTPGSDRPAGQSSRPQGSAAPPEASKDGDPTPRSPFSGSDAQVNEGCRVYSQPSSSDGGPVDDPGENDGVSSCEYRATAAAGYSGSGTWTLEIVRDGDTITYDSVSSPACAAVGVVQPGDLVRARLGLRGSQGTPLRASAGEGQWHLDVAPGIIC